LIGRLGSAQERYKRPMLLEGELESVVKKLFEERVHFYRQAHRKIIL
jgi:shikimate kinase